MDTKSHHSNTTWSTLFSNNHFFPPQSFLPTFPSPLSLPNLSSYFPLPSFSPKPFFLLFPPSLFPTPPSPSQHIEEGDYLTPGQVKWAVPPLREQDLQGSAHTLHLKEQRSVTGRERVNQMRPMLLIFLLAVCPIACTCHSQHSP